MGDYIYKFKSVVTILQNSISIMATAEVRDMENDGWEYVPEGNCVINGLEEYTMILTFRKPK